MSIYIPLTVPTGNVHAILTIYRVDPHNTPIEELLLEV